MINKVGKFEKVSFEQYLKDFKKLYFEGCEDDCDEEVVREMYDEIELPTRASEGSAGYDFYSPLTFRLRPGEGIWILTGIRVRIDEGWHLELSPKSGLGTNYRMQLDNTIGKIDSDYYGSKNEGHIMAKITNDSKIYKEINIEAGHKFLQGSFLMYGITYDDEANGKRNGGFGSTGK